MDRPRLIRGLRIAWTAFFGILCVLLIVSWVRSYWWMDIVAIPRPPERFMAVSYYGRIYWSKVALDKAVSEPDAVGSLTIHDDWTMVQKVIDDLFDDGSYHSAGHVIWVLVAGTLAAFPWAESKWQFSLRALLIATTLFAVVLGLAIAYLRLW
jgi:hypothetical protein